MGSKEFCEVFTIGRALCEVFVQPKFNQVIGTCRNMASGAGEILHREILGENPHQVAVLANPDESRHRREVELNARRHCRRMVKHGLDDDGDVIGTSDTKRVPTLV